MCNLEKIWEALTFRDLSSDFDTVITGGIICWAIVLAFVAIVVVLISQPVYTLYRLIAYDYEEMSLDAKVVRTKLRTEVLCETAYNVHIITNNGLSAIIPDEDMYYRINKGDPVHVTMRVGRSRRAGHEIKYWKVIDYSW